MDRAATRKKSGVGGYFPKLALVSGKAAPQAKFIIGTNCFPSINSISISIYQFYIISENLITNLLKRS